MAYKAPKTKLDSLHVSASALFYSVSEKSSDDGLLNMVDQIVEKELLKTSETIKNQIRNRENPRAKGAVRQ
ncbi:MAG: hypothetical protein LBT39_06865 [Treponema sp.]|jgi:hypothetical protein|nr:hypothetical protein [Treponema sp.]